MKALGNRIVTGHERFHISMLHGQQLCTGRGVRVMFRWSFLKAALDWCSNDKCTVHSAALNMQHCNTRNVSWNPQMPWHNSMELSARDGCFVLFIRFYIFRTGSKLMLDNYGFELLLLLLFILFYANVDGDSSTVGCSCRKRLRGCVIVLHGVQKKWWRMRTGRHETTKSGRI
jgi:hypothetical protein